MAIKVRFKIREISNGKSVISQTGIFEKIIMAGEEYEACLNGRDLKRLQNDATFVGKVIDSTSKPHYRKVKIGDIMQSVPKLTLVQDDNAWGTDVDVDENDDDGEEEEAEAPTPDTESPADGPVDDEDSSDTEDELEPAPGAPAEESAKEPADETPADEAEG